MYLLDRIELAFPTFLKGTAGKHTYYMTNEQQDLSHPSEALHKQEASSEADRDVKDGTHHLWRNV